MQISISLHIRLQNYRLFFTPYRRAKECIMVGEKSFFWGRGGRRTGHFEAWGGKGLFPVSVSLFVCCVGNVCLSVACIGIWRPTCEREREEWRKEKGQKMNIKKSRTILPGIIPYTVLDLYIKWRRPTLPLCAVPSARSGLTSLFGMGRGGTLTL